MSLKRKASEPFLTVASNKATCLSRDPMETIATLLKPHEKLTQENHFNLTINLEEDGPLFLASGCPLPPPDITGKQESASINVKISMIAGRTDPTGKPTLRKFLWKLYRHYTDQVAASYRVGLRQKTSIKHDLEGKTTEGVKNSPTLWSLATKVVPYLNTRDAMEVFSNEDTKFTLRLLPFNSQYLWFHENENLMHTVGTFRASNLKDLWRQHDERMLQMIKKRVRLPGLDRRWLRRAHEVLVEGQQALDQDRITGFFEKSVEYLGSRCEDSGLYEIDDFDFSDAMR